MSRFPHTLIFWIGVILLVLGLLALSPLALIFTHRAAADGDNRNRASHRSVVPAGRDLPSVARATAFNQSAGSLVFRGAVFGKFPRESNTGADNRPTLPAGCAI